MHLFASWYNRICDSCLFHDHKHVSKEWNIFFFFLCILYRCSLRIDTWNSVDYIKVLSLKTLLLLCLNLSCKLKSLINSEKPQSTGGLWMPWRATFLRFPAWVTAAITLGRLLFFFLYFFVAWILENICYKLVMKSFKTSHAVKYLLLVGSWLLAGVLYVKIAWHQIAGFLSLSGLSYRFVSTWFPFGGTKLTIPPTPFLFLPKFATYFATRGVGMHLSNQTPDDMQIYWP